MIFHTHVCFVQLFHDNDYTSYSIIDEELLSTFRIQCPRHSQTFKLLLDSKESQKYIQDMLYLRLDQTEESLSQQQGKSVVSSDEKKLSFFPYLTHPAKIDLNKKSLPKQKTIQNFNIDAQGIRKTRNENPPMWEIRVTS